MDEQKPMHIVILVHGIRDDAFWQFDFEQFLSKANLPVSKQSHGYFPLYKFLWPFFWPFRAQAVRHTEEGIRSLRLKHPDAKLSIIAHSFGAYVVAELLKRGETKFHKVLFCGGVVPNDYAFNTFSCRFDGDVLNDVGSRDYWPALAANVTFGYGSSGTFGFRKSQSVYDRRHCDAGHGWYLNKDYAEKFAIPFLQDGTIVPGGVECAKPWWAFLVRFAKAKYLMVLAPILLSYWLLQTEPYKEVGAAMELYACEGPTANDTYIAWPHDGMPTDCVMIGYSGSSPQPKATMNFVYRSSRYVKSYPYGADMSREYAYGTLVTQQYKAPGARMMYWADGNEPQCDDRIYIGDIPGCRMVSAGYLVPCYRHPSQESLVPFGGEKCDDPRKRH